MAVCQVAICIEIGNMTADESQFGLKMVLLSIFNLDSDAE